MKLLRKRICWDGEKLTIEILNLSDSVIVFLYDSKRGLGTLAFALPRSEEEPSRSAIFIGGKYRLLSRIIAERLAFRYRKPVLALIRLKLPENESMRRIAGLLKSLPEL